MILHVDMDAFYASIEQREQPLLRGKPIVVGGSPTGRGVVSAASYEARKFGIHSAMPTSRALQLCPRLIVVRTRMDFYVQVSRQIREIFHRFTPEVEPLSLDEAFLDVSRCIALFGSAETIGRAIKQAIADELNLVASVGVAPNKFLAKLASDLEKPNGFTVISADRVLEILAPLPVKRLWGVGKVTERRFSAARIHKFGDLQQMDVAHARHLLGDSGEHFWRLARGIDSRSVVTDRQAKSISHETTFFEDTADGELLAARLLDLTEQVAMRLRQQHKLARTVQLKLRFNDFQTITRAQTLSHPSDSTDALWRAARDLLARELTGLRNQLGPSSATQGSAIDFAGSKPARPMRLLGIGVSGLDSADNQQYALFDDSGKPTSDHELGSTTDAIRQKFGRYALRRAATLQHGVNRKRPPPADD